MRSSRRWLDLAALSYCACIAAVYLYLASGPRLAGRLVEHVSNPPAWLIQISHTISSDSFRTILLLVAYGGLWLLYVAALIGARRTELSARRVWAWGIVFALLLLPMPPYFSEDVIGYAQQGRLLAHYGQNPYEHTLSEYGDPWVQSRLHWSSQKAPYGPLLTVLHTAASGVAGGSLVTAIVLLKLLMLACFLLTAWLVQKILQRVAPRAAVAGLLFFLWNPMALLEIPGQGHNDAVMMTLMMGGLWLIVRQKPAPGFVALFLSFLTKFTTAILLPLHLALLLRRRAWGSIAMAGGVSLALAAGFYLMFFRGPDPTAGLREVSALAWLSPIWLGSELLRRNGWESEAARRVFQLPLTAAFAVFVLWRMTRVVNEKALLREAGFVLMFFLLLVNNQMNPWYLTLLLPVAAVTRHPVTRSVAVAISLWPAVMYFRPFFYQPPFWANVGRMLLFYAGMSFAMWYGLRAAQALRVPALGVPAPSVAKPLPEPVAEPSPPPLAPEWAATEEHPRAFAARAGAGQRRSVH